MKQFLITPAMGKKLIAKAMLKHPSIQKTLNKGKLVIVAGTTNGYIAEEILTKIKQQNQFSRDRFFRGITVPFNILRTPEGRLVDENVFKGDVVIIDGQWKRGLTIFDVVDDLQEGDVILKGANTLNLSLKQVGIYIGNPQGGTILAALKAHVGRRVKLILPVGLEKRIPEDINEIALKLNHPGAKGPRMLPVPGEIITEIDAIKMLSGAEAFPVAAGGVAGAEGSIYLAVSGSKKQVKLTQEIIETISAEDIFRL
ncbi:MAG: hypothetical protein CIT03_10010 [Methanobacterium sp.]|nr:MAG: hypothetical protein CIT03_10010 [Methanobacterium sp.]